jgi:hypothetical protein
LSWRAASGVGLLVIAVAIATFLVGHSSGGGTSSAPERTEAAPVGAAYATLPTVKCKTVVGYRQPATALGATTQVAIPTSLSEGLAAYRDRAGTTVVAPVGWACEAGIGVDGSEHVTAYPKGQTNPGEEAGETGDVVQLDIASACQGCQAEALCTLFPEAKPVSAYYEGIEGAECPEKPLHEEVSYPSSSVALFGDPSGVKGSGVGSGGKDPSVGALTFSEALGVHKVSCTMTAADREICGAIVAAALASAPAVG